MTVRIVTNRMTKAVERMGVADGFVDPKVKTQYHKAPHPRSEERKQEQRDHVIEHFRGCLDRRYYLRVLSFPGVSWAFERQLYELWDRHAEFVCLEHSPAILHSSVQNAPGWCMRLHEHMGYHGFSNNCVAAMCASAYEFFMHSRKGTTCAERKLWSMRYRQNNAVWLDFTSNICDDVLAVLRRVGLACSPRFDPVPLCVTFYYGREAPQYMRMMEAVADGILTEAGQRVALVRAMLNEQKFRSFEMRDWREWPSSRSDVGSTIMICGWLHLLEPFRG